jgi:hypothetical protein
LRNKFFIVFSRKRLQGARIYASKVPAKADSRNVSILQCIAVEVLRDWELHGSIKNIAFGNILQPRTQKNTDTARLVIRATTVAAVSCK